jgi:hypothetical protein
LGTCDSVTVGLEKFADWLGQALTQLMPAGLLVTVPCPVVEVAFVTVTEAKVEAKSALTLLAALMVTTQVPVPVQPDPVQPLKTEFAPAAAVKVTTVFCWMRAEQVAPQLMPPTSLVTEAIPAAEPVFVTESWKVTPAKVAVTVRAMFMLTVHGPVPVQVNPASALLHPRNVLPEEGVAVSVTFTPVVKSADVPEHAALQLMPAGLLVTVPVAPAVEVFWRESVCVVETGPPNRA